MPSLDGFSVHVTCGGVRLDEYSTKIRKTDGFTASCWIPSEADKRFSIEYNWNTEEKCLFRLSLKCDGVGMRDSIVKATDGSHTHDKARGPDGYFAMLFSRLVQTDSEEAALREVNPKLGEITVRIWRVAVRGELDKNRPSSKSRLDTSPVHESKKKLGGHRIALGEMLGPRSATHLDAVKLDDQPFRAFKFRYRPREMLRALGYIPEPRAIAYKRRLSQLSNEEEKDELDSEEEDVINAKIHSLSQQLDSLRKHKRVKREASPSTVILGGNREVIDLTSD